MGHKLVHHVSKAPTCTEVGWDAYDTCSRCDYTTYKEKAALGHDLVHHEAKAPTCTEAGWDAYDTCSRCDYTTYKKKAALGHDLVHHEAKAPNYITKGTEEYWECSVCGKLFSDSEGKKAISEPVIVPVLEPKNKVEAFVIRCYSVILSRNPDPHGLEDWTNQLKSSEHAASEIIDGFVNSEEFKNKNLSDEDAIIVLYNAMLNRDPDPEGLANWTKVLEEGNPFGAVINGFCGSVEFMGLCKEYGIEPGSVKVGPAGARAKIEAFVTRCYNIILSRDADPSGLADWADSLEQGTRSAAEVIDGFINSQEFLNRKLSNEASVTILYNAMLNREPDATGLMNWTNLMNQGAPYAMVINGFCESEEFNNICREYGINAGSVTVRGTSEKAASITPASISPKTATKAVRAPEYTNEEKIREFVRHCYLSVLGREADEKGLNHYTELILKGKNTPKQVAHNFIFSDEFRNRMPGNEELIRILYRLYLYRDADEAGLADWIEQLSGGMTLESVVNGFSNSDEFKALIASLKK